MTWWQRDNVVAGKMRVEEVDQSTTRFSRGMYCANPGCILVGLCMRVRVCVCVCERESV